MAGRQDYFDDPAAPAATSLVVAAVAYVEDADGRVLLIRRADNGLWALPGGGQELGESTSDAAVRETYEETGVHIEITGLIGVYSDPRHLIAYDDGEVRQEFSVSLRGVPVGGAPRVSDESREVRWVAPGELAGLEMDRSMRVRVEDGLRRRPEAYVR